MFDKPTKASDVEKSVEENIILQTDKRRSYL